MRQEIITIRGVEHTYAKGDIKVKALACLDLTVDKGEIYGFIGPNGAGKTTTIKLLLGILEPVKGEISVFGEPAVRPETRARVGYMPEIAEYYRYLTPAELLIMYGRICAIEEDVLRDRAVDLLHMVGLENTGKRLIGTFSKGMTQKLSFAQALVNDPDLLILDEPTSGLDPVARRNMREVILGLKERGKTVFFSSHELSEVELISDRIGVLHNGRLVVTGPTKDLLGGKDLGQSLENYFLDMIGERQ